MLAILPLTASALTTPTVVSSDIGSVISLLSSSGTVHIDATPNASGVQTIASDTVTVSTNDASGYTLKLGETAAASALTSGGNSIASIGATAASPIALTVGTWGYRVDNVAGFGVGPTSAVSNVAIGSLQFASIPVTATPDTLKTTATTATNDVTTVWYGVAVNTSTPSGAYTNSVTYTATAN